VLNYYARNSFHTSLHFQYPMNQEVPESVLEGKVIQTVFIHALRAIKGKGIVWCAQIMLQSMTILSPIIKCYIYLRLFLETHVQYWCECNSLALNLNDSREFARDWYGAAIMWHSIPARGCRGCNFSWIVVVASKAARIFLPNFQCDWSHTALLSDVYLEFWATDSPDLIRPSDPGMHLSYFSLCLSMAGRWPFSSISTSCVVPLREDWVIFCHAGSAECDQPGKNLRYIHSPTDLSFWY